MDIKVDAEAAEYATMDRVSDTVSELLTAHHTRHDAIKAALRERDAAAADILDDMLATVQGACESDDAASSLAAVIKSTYPSFDAKAAN